MPFHFREDEVQPSSEYVEDFRKHAHAAVDWVADYLAHVREYPVLPRVAPGDLTDALPRSGPEQIIETYYSLPLYTWRVTFDYQFIDNPGYNRDRGPASVIAARLHSQF